MTEQSTALPDLPDEAVARIEQAVFDRIADEPARGAPATASAKRISRRRGWLTGAGIAAAFVVGVLVTPPLLSAVDTTTTADAPAIGITDDGGVPEMASEDSAASESTAIGDAATSADADAGRELIATAYAQIEVEDVAAAVASVGALAEEHGGYTESTSISQNAALDDTSMPVAPDTGTGWITVRVPSADLTGVIDGLVDSGTVLSSSVSKQDVTSTAVDLRARVSALEASVARLTELMAQSGTVSELIEAEVALTDRQAELESYQQQLASLEDQVAMSSLQVQLVREQVATTADPAGFGDGLLAGWNGLIVSLNALVVALGFLLPWLLVAAVVLVIVWAIRRRANRAKRTIIDEQ